jgi:anti-anti-sigma factor
MQEERAPMSERHRTHRIAGGCVVLYPDNYINDIEGEKLEELCDTFIGKGFTRVVVDFSETDLINSIGISILIGMIEKIKDKKGDIVFSGLKKVNHKVFDIVGLTRHIRIFDTEQQAIDASQRSSEPDDAPSAGLQDSKGQVQLPPVGTA